MGKTLKVGVLLPYDGMIKGWQIFLIEELKKNVRLKLFGVVSDVSSFTTVSPSSFKYSNPKESVSFLSDLITKMEFSFFKKQFEWIGNYKTEASTTASHFISIEGLNTDTDVWINLRADLTPFTLPVSCFGVLSLEHDGFSEAIQDQFVTEAKLICTLFTPKKTSYVLKRGAWPTYRYSPSANFRKIRMHSLWMIVDTINELVNGHYNEQHVTSVSSSLIPNSETINLAEFFKISERIMRRILKGIFYTDHWGLVLKENGIETKIESTKSHVLADPFIIEKNNQKALLFEECRKNSKHAKISSLWISNPLETEHKYDLISSNTHLSYPYIFEDKGETYMIPETAQTHKVELYKMKRFPDHWEPQSTLLSDLSATDTILFQHAGYYWMFTNIDRSGNGDHCSELFIYYSKSLDEEWKAHPQSPVVQDCRYARNAGGILIDAEKQLYRVAQYNGSRYGAGISLQKIKKLTITQYSEENSKTFIADRDDKINGMHHLSMSSNAFVLDFRREILNLKKWFSKSTPNSKKETTIRLSHGLEKVSKHSKVMREFIQTIESYGLMPYESKKQILKNNFKTKSTLRENGLESCNRH